jgi:hypothetical protein
MRSIKSSESVEIDQTLENDFGRNIRTLTRNSVAPGGGGEPTGDSLAALLRRVSEASSREIESLIGELHGLRNKLESHGARIQSDIAKYAELSQGVMQLTIIISDNVKKLPSSVADDVQ